MSDLLLSDMLWGWLVADPAVHKHLDVLPLPLNAPPKSPVHGATIRATGQRIFTELFVLPEYKKLTGFTLSAIPGEDHG